MILVFQVILLRGSAEQIIRIDHNIYIKEANDSPKEFGAQRGREVLGEECSLINLERVVKKPSRGEKPT